MNSLIAMTIQEWADKNAGPRHSEAVVTELLRILEQSPDHFSADTLSDLHELCDDELTKRDAAVCGGQKYLGATWFERGVLPPVGAFVDVTGDVVYGEGEKGCEVIAHVEDCAVIRMSWGLGCFVAKALSPHRTERDDAVEAMKALCPYKGSWEATYRLFAEALYDAGYRAGGSE